DELLTLIPAGQWKDYHSIEPRRPVENVLLEASRIVGGRDTQYPTVHTDHAVEGVEQVFLGHHAGVRKAINVLENDNRRLGRASHGIEHVAEWVPQIGRAH